MFPMPFSKRSRFHNLQQGSGNRQPIIHLVSGSLRAHLRRTPTTSFSTFNDPRKKLERNTECHSSYLFSQYKTDSLSQSVALKGTEISPRAGTEYDSST